MEQLPNCMPTSKAAWVPVHVRRSHLEMGLDNQKVIVMLCGTLMAWYRWKLEVWILFLVSQPWTEPHNY